MLRDYRMGYLGNCALEMPPDYEYTASAAEDWATGGTGLMEPLPDIDEDNE